MAKRQHTFSLRVHLGLMSIIALLLLVNSVTNYILWRARETQEQVAIARFDNAARAVSRSLNEQFPQPLSEAQTDRLKSRYQLSRITVVPSVPPDNSPAGRREWFAAIAPRVPPSEWPDLAEKLLAGTYRSLLRASDDEFYVVYPVRIGAGKQLVIIHDHLPQLTVIEKARSLWSWISILSLSLVAVIYLLLVQLVVRPVHRILKQAREAGRIPAVVGDEAEMAVAEYERTITELRLRESELMRLHEALKQRADSLEQFNRYLLTSMDAGVVTFDRNGELKTINPAARRFLNLPEDSEHAEVADVYDRVPELRELTEVILRENSQPMYREITCEIAEDRKVFGVLTTRIHDEAGETVGGALLLNDLTELHRLRTGLEQKSRLAALGEMAAGLAHQIRNSLGAITGFARLVKRRADSDDLRRSSDALLSEAEQAGELIERFLSFARPLDMHPVPVDVAALLRELVAALELKPECERIAFSHFGEQELYVSGDALLLKQVFGNILDNAVKACAGRDATIVIDVETADSATARVTVSDNGPGISPEDMKRLFTPFFSTRPSGTGLGLSVAAKIVDEHGGAITVDSSPGHGAVFTVHLPLAVPAERPTTQFSSAVRS